MARTSLCAYLPLAGKVGMPSANSGHATPQWVYDLGVSLVTEVDNSVLPDIDLSDNQMVLQEVAALAN